MAEDLKAAGQMPPDLTQQYRSMIANGIPPSVALNILIKPSYAEDAAPRGGWPFPYAGQDREAIAGQQVPQNFQPPMPRSGPRDISYQPGANAMAGGWGNPGGGAPGMGGGLTPDMLKRIQLYQLLMQNRGTGGMPQNPFGGGMQFGQNAPGGAIANQLANPSQQGGGLIAALLQNPDLLKYFMQLPGGQPGQFPQGGGGVSLAQLLGAPSQTTGQPA